tara:strand:- start:50 stop:370 length:321 start_codon:yes stop_codon:yes gene_type:complete
VWLLQEAEEQEVVLVDHLEQVELEEQLLHVALVVEVRVHQQEVVVLQQQVLPIEVAVVEVELIFVVLDKQVDQVLLLLECLEALVCQQRQGLIVYQHYQVQRVDVK